jgi:hypothetical protein
MAAMQKTFALLIMLLVTSPVFCAQKITEYQQKAQLIRYIINKVSWPADSISKNQFTICVLGNLEDNHEIEQLNGNTIKKNNLLVKKIALGSQPDTTCQLVYVAKDKNEEQQRIIKLYATRPILLLGDMDHFASLGGSMNFVALNDQIGLTINQDSLKQAKLTMDLHTFEQVIVVPETIDLE